jgi:hypothetical protein
MIRRMALQQMTQLAFVTLCVITGMCGQSAIADEGPPMPGLNASMKALSSDTRWVALATKDPPTLWLLDAQHHVLRRYLSQDSRAMRPSQISAIWTNTNRKSFLIEQASIAELWEVSYDPHAEPLYEGLVHDYRMQESIATPGFLGVRRIALDAPMRVLALSPNGKHAILTPQSTEAVVAVVHLDIRRPIARLQLRAPPGNTATVCHTGTHDALALPSVDGRQAPIIDMTTWQIIEGELACSPIKATPTE